MEIITAILILFGMAFYFMPSIIANQRKHKSTNQITLANIFFGWTFFGWIICLVWCVGPNVKEDK